MSTSAEPQTPALRILLIEDDADDVLLCRDAIRHSGLQCSLVVLGTLRDAVDHLAHHDTDVALVDLSLPDAQRLDAVTTLARHSPHLPIVVLTGLRDEQTACSALHAGAQDYLVKGPASRETVGRAVRFAIERKRGEQARRARDDARAAQQRAEHTARELERNYRRLFDSNPYPMYVYDTGTLTFLEVNDAAVAYYGYSREEFLTRNLTQLSLVEDVTSLSVAVATDGIVARCGPLRQVKRDGTVVEVTITSHLLPFDGREARCAVIEDITEKEQLERRLRQSQRLESLGQLAGGVAHDFNNLLSIIVGYASACLQELSAAPADGAAPQVRGDLHGILGAAERAANLTRQLLSFARAEVAQTRVVDLNAIIGGIEQMLRRAMGANIDAHIRLCPQPAPITADPGRVDQVLLNLVVNARDAMPTGGTITVTTDTLDADEHYATHHPGIRVGRYVCLTVSDTGTGMSQATIDRAFEPFFTTKPKGYGTGLGLSTIYGIVTQSGGQVQIHSRPGAGTTITTLFPLTQQPGDTLQPAADNREPQLQ